MPRSLLAPLAAVALLAAVPGALDPAAARVQPPRFVVAATPGTVSRLLAPTTRYHYIANVGSQVRAVRRLGYDVVDTGPGLAEIRALPRRTQALVYLGQDCPTPAGPAFRRVIRRLGHLHRVFGYYLADEPSLSGCPGGPAALASRADYIRTVSGGTQQSMIVLDRGYHAFRPHVTHVTMVGIDTYPCSTAAPSCSFGDIRHDLGTALRAGIPRRTVVPVYQGFGQERTSSTYYLLPTPDQMRTMLRRWAALVPHPPMDYTYSWGHQSSANPTLRDSAPLQRVFADYFAG